MPGTTGRGGVISGGNGDGYATLGSTSWSRALPSILTALGGHCPARDPRGQKLFKDDASTKKS